LNSQFGNLLLLTAAHSSPHLSCFIPKPILADLYVGTIWFLNAFAQPSSALHHDLILLAGLAKKLFRLNQLDSPPPGM
jgi:hypothetical protein